MIGVATIFTYVSVMNFKLHILVLMVLQNRLKGFHELYCLNLTLNCVQVC